MTADKRRMKMKKSILLFVMILLVLTSKKSRAPKAEGIPYDKSTR